MLPRLSLVRASALAGLGRHDELGAVLDAGLAAARDQGLPLEEALLVVHGDLATARENLAAVVDRDIPDNLWWSKDAGGPGNGVHINDALPVNPSPLVGGQNWFDNVATIKKL